MAESEDQIRIGQFPLSDQMEPFLLALLVVTAVTCGLGLLIACLLLIGWLRLHCYAVPPPISSPRSAWSP